MNQNSSSPTQSSDSEARRLIDVGLALSQQGQSVDAISRFREGIGHAPGWYLAHFLLGSEYAAAGDQGAAEACFAQTVLLAPEFHLARYQLGLLQFSGGRPHVAMVSWASLQLLPPDQPFPHLVDAFTALMSDQLHEARAQFMAAVPLARNAGLEADIGKLIARLDEQAGAGAMARAAAEAAAGPTVKTEAQSHVLLSNYASDTFH